MYGVLGLVRRPRYTVVRPIIVRETSRGLSSPGCLRSDGCFDAPSISDGPGVRVTQAARAIRRERPFMAEVHALGNFFLQDM